MNAFLLRREYELQLPNSFVDVDCEEMEYVEGGVGYVEALANTLGDLPKTQYWWGVAWNLSGETRDDVVNKFMDAAYAIGLYTVIAGGVAGTITAGIGFYFAGLTAMTGMAVYRIGQQIRDAKGGATLSCNASGFHVNPW